MSGAVVGMFAWAKNFVNRHKKKLIALGLLTGGVYAAGKFIKWKLTDIQEREAEEYLKQAKKQFHYDSNQKTCLTTFVQFMVILRDKVCELLDTEEIILSISKQPRNKRELWEELKIVSFAKAVTSIVSCCLLFVFLKVQMNLIAGYMYVENAEDLEGSRLLGLDATARDTDRESSIIAIEKDYLNNVKVFFEDGIFLLAQDIKEIVKDNIGSTELKAKISHQDLSKIFYNIWEKFKSQMTYADLDYNSGFSAGCAKYLLDVSGCRKGAVCSNEEKYQKIMSETLDVVESDDFKTVLFECTEKNIEELSFSMEASFQNYFDESTSKLASAESVHLESLGIPLAKLIPILNAQMNQIFKAGQNGYLENLISNETLNTFSANIYESFSQEV